MRCSREFDNCRASWIMAISFTHSSKSWMVLVEDTVSKDGVGNIEKLVEALHMESIDAHEIGWR